MARLSRSESPHERTIRTGQAGQWWPESSETKIRFSTERNSNVEVTIYSILGEKINVVQNGQLDAGTYDISWFGQDSQGNKVPSGVYFYEVKSDNRTAKGKMLLLK